MKQFTSLVWKEWQEARAYLWIGLGIFVGLPVIGGLQYMVFHHAKQFGIVATPWVVTLGGLLAVFVGVGTTCRDFDGRLEDFWRSRPISVHRWLLTKYIVGLAVVLAACLFPLLLELAISPYFDSANVIIWYPFMWSAMYSIGFLSGCLFRRTAHAAMFAVAAMLLVYFLPMILPPLEWMGSTSFMEVEYRFRSATVGAGPRQLEFAGGMLGVAAAALALAVFSVRLGWQVVSGRKMMYGSVSAALLILFASAGFQLGTNLPVLLQADLPPDERVFDLRYDGGRASLISTRINPNDKTRVGDLFYRTIDLDASGMKLGSPVRFDAAYFYGFWAVSAPERPDVQYEIHSQDKLNAESDDILMIDVFIAGASTEADMEAGAIHLWDQKTQDSWPFIFAWENRLYVIGTHLVTLDISQPTKPRILSDTQFASHWFHWNWLGTENSTFVPPEKFEVTLPSVPDLPPWARLAAAVDARRDYRLEGDTFCAAGGDVVCIYHLSNLTPLKATFDKAGLYAPSMLERAFGRYSINSMWLKNGFLYITDGGSTGLLNPHITVFDVRSRRPLRPIGHFAAPGAGVVCPLPDGRALVAGSKLWLVGPPPHRSADE